MKPNKKGILIVLSGPSGVGKDSVLSRVFTKRMCDLKLAVSYTTRSPRVGEQNGKDYYFVDKENFMNIADSGGMLEYACYCGNYYGTPVREVEEQLEKGKTVILEIEVQGACQIIKKCPWAVSVFVAPPSLKSLKERLVKRGTDIPESIKGRITQAKKEIISAQSYNYIVVNDSLDKCADDIIKIIDAENMKSSRMKNIIDEVLQNE